jgi:hypothetical protein
MREAHVMGFGWRTLIEQRVEHKVCHIASGTAFEPVFGVGDDPVWYAPATRISGYHVTCQSTSSATLLQEHDQSRWIRKTRFFQDLRWMRLSRRRRYPFQRIWMPSFDL